MARRAPIFCHAASLLALLGLASPALAAEYGEVCSTHSACSSDICAYGLAGSTAYCSKSCSDDDDCPGTDQCKSSNKGMICRKDDLGGSPDGGVPDSGTPPQVSITAPGDQTQVGETVEVVVQAEDDEGVEKVELEVDGQLAAAQNATPYAFSVTLQPGTHVLTAVAYDVDGASAEASVSVTVPGAEEESGDGAAPDPGPAPGAFGALCAVPEDCDNELCIYDSAYDAHYCAQLCDPGNTCPFVNAECIESGGAAVCALTSAPQNPLDPGETGGCSLATDPHRGTGLLLVGLLLGASLLTRRRRDR